MPHSSKVEHHALAMTNRRYHFQQAGYVQTDLVPI